MATIINSGIAGKSSSTDYPEAGLRFKLLLGAGSVWLLTGLFMDGWAHNNIPDLIDSFFTPWHAVLYSGFAVLAVILSITYLINVRRGFSWMRGLPRAYMPSLLGVIIFSLAGNADLIWHTLFGFEENVEALLSPSHLSLALGGILITGGLWRELNDTTSPSAQAKTADRALGTLSLFVVMMIFTFFGQFANAFSHPDVYVDLPTMADTYFWDVTLISYVLLPTALLMSFVLMMLRAKLLRTGTLALFVAGSALLMFVLNIDQSAAHWPVLVAAFITAGLAEGLRSVLRPSIQRPVQSQILSFVMPFSLFALYFAALLLTEGIWWRIHLWLGASVLAGIVGYGLSVLILPQANQSTANHTK